MTPEDSLRERADADASSSIIASPMWLASQKERARIWDGIKLDYEGWEDYRADCQRHFSQFGPKTQKLLISWLLHAKNLTTGEEPDLGRVNSPPFDELSFQECGSIEQLAESLKADFWMPGDSFFYEDICLVNRSRDASTWLLLKGNIVLGDLLLNDRRRKTSDLAAELKSALSSFAPVNS